MLDCVFRRFLTARSRTAISKRHQHRSQGSQSFSCPVAYLWKFCVGCYTAINSPSFPRPSLPFLLCSPWYSSQGFAVVQTIELACVPRKISCLHALVCYYAKTANSVSGIQILFKGHYCCLGSLSNKCIGSTCKPKWNAHKNKWL